MQAVYAFAEAIVDSAQPSKDGGLFTFILANFVPKPASPSVSLGPTNDSQTTKATPKTPSYGAHFGYTATRDGYSVGLASGAVLFVSVTVLFGLTCYRVRRSKRRAGPKSDDRQSSPLPSQLAHM
ncbi:unnamed protein product, partial [Protopolystoma xenopodis]